jgi:tetratricopeptide (TPR) repeat protein
MAQLKRNLNVAFALVVLGVACSGCTKEIRKARHLSRGNSDFQAQKFDQAEIEYLKVLQLSPLQPDAVRNLAIIYQDQGKFVHAHYFLSKAIQSQPDDPKIRLKLAMNELALGDSRKAVEDARLVLAKQPGQPEALELVASSAVSSNGLQGVRQQIANLRQTDQDRASYHVAFGDVELRLQNVTNAETEFKKALELDPKSSSAFIGLSSIYMARKDFPAAEQALKSAVDLSPLRSGARLRYAQFKYATGKHDEAKQVLQQLTTQAPDYLPAWNLLAEMALEEKKYSDCNSLVERVLARDSMNLDAMMLNGSLRMAQGDSTNAVANFTRMAAIYIRSPQVFFQLARAQLMKNDVPKAMASLNQAITINPDFAEAVLLLANLNIRKGYPALAISGLSELLKRQPRNGQAQLLLIDAYLAKKDPANALAAGRQMAEAFPNSSEVQVVLGSLLFRDGQNAEARQAFEKALALSPDYLVAVERLTDLDLAEKQYTPAVQRVRARIEKNPSAAEPLVLLARIYIAQAQASVDEMNKSANPPARKLRLIDLPSVQPLLKQAEDSLVKAIQLNPALRSSYFMLSDLYIASGKQQQALEPLNSLLSKTNDVSALMQVGMIQDSLKNYSAARDSYEKLLSIDPDYSRALNNLAYFYSEREVDLDKAYKLAEKAHQLLPDDGPTADTLGWILYKRADYTRALSMLQEGAAKLPDDPEIQYHLGMTQYMLGNEGPARLALEPATQSSKDFPGKDVAARRLALLAIDPKTADATALAALQKQLQDTPRDPIALVRLGAIQERDGQLDKAVETYETALKYDPQISAIALKLAQLYASPRLNDAQKALALAKTAHDQAPDNPQASALLGQLVYRTGDCRWAASLLEDSARKLPDDPQVAFDLAWAYYGVGRVADAKTLMQKVASGDASSSKAEDAKRFLTTVAAAEDPTRAAAFASDAQKMLAADPAYVPALMVSASVQEAQGSYQKALDTYNQILSRFPLFTPATRNLGLLYFAHLNEDQKAYDLTLKAREAFPQDPDVAKALGVLTYRKGNYSRAAQLLKESAQSRKGDAELLYYLGMAQYQLKAKPESKAALQQALSFDLPSKLAEDAKRVLAELK